MRSLASLQIKVKYLIEAIALLLAMQSSGIANAQIEVSITVRDVRNNSPFVGNVVCHVKGNQFELEAKQPGRYELKNLAARVGEEIRLEISGAPQYGERKIKLQNKMALKKVSLTLHAAKKFPNYTFQYLEQGLEYHARGEFDRALAYYEIAYFMVTPSNPVIQFDVKLKYNYARGLANACTRNSYATCEEAKQIYVGLKDNAGQYPSLFSRERISVAELDKTLRDIDAAIVGLQYTMFLDLFRKGEYADAGNTAEQLLVQFDGQTAAFADARLTKDRLREDTATAYVRASEIKDIQETAGERKRLLAKALRYFKDIEGKNEIVTKNISFIEQVM